jgi:hypothetical protein
MQLTYEQSRSDALARLAAAVDELTAAATLADMCRADNDADRRISDALDADLISQPEFSQWLDRLDRARSDWQRSHA